MSYFKNFGLVNYRYGNEDESQRVLTNDLSIYVNLLDEIDDVIGFYEYYYILDGDRPDTLSYKFYGTSDYYWTFYLMNPTLKESGWPLSTKELIAYSKKLFKGGSIDASDITKTDWQNLDPDGVNAPFKYEFTTLTGVATPTDSIVTLTIPSDAFLGGQTVNINADATGDNSNKIVVADANGGSDYSQYPIPLIPGYNIAGLNIPEGTTITAVDYFTGVITLSNDLIDDYSSANIPPTTFPVDFTCWSGDAKQIKMVSFTEDVRAGDYLADNGSPDVITPSGGHKITKVDGDTITLENATTRPILDTDTFEVYGELDVYRQHQLGQVTIKDNNRNGEEFHIVVPNINAIYDKDANAVWSGALGEVVTEIDGIHHYENSAGEWQDAVFATDPYGDVSASAVTIGVSAPPSSSIITNYEELEKLNEETRRIRIIKPNIISRIVTEFQRLVKG